MAVKKQVVLPMAWLKDTGMYLRLTFARTMVTQKMLASRKTCIDTDPAAVRGGTVWRRPDAAVISSDQRAGCCWRGRYRLPLAPSRRMTVADVWP